MLLLFCFTMRMKYVFIFSIELILHQSFYLAFPILFFCGENIIAIWFNESYGNGDLTSASFFCRSITVKNFLTAVRSYLEEHHEASPMLRDLVTCKRDDTLEDIILRLDHEKIHRIYVVDKEENLQGVITLRDIISKLVHEPHGYFGDFFYGVVPLPESSRVWKITPNSTLWDWPCRSVV